MSFLNLKLPENEAKNTWDRFCETIFDAWKTVDVSTILRIRDEQASLRFLKIRLLQGGLGIMLEFCADAKFMASDHLVQKRILRVLAEAIHSKMTKYQVRMRA